MKNSKNTAGELQKYYRSTTGVLQEYMYYRSTTELQEHYKRTTIFVEIQNENEIDFVDKFIDGFEKSKCQSTSKTRSY